VARRATQRERELFERAQGRMSASVRDARTRMLARVADTEEELQRVRSGVVRAVRADPRWRGRRVSESDPTFAVVVQERLDATLREREREIIGSMREAARRGSRIERRAAVEVFGEQAEDEIAVATRADVARFSRQLARDARYSVDGLTLSRRLHRIDRRTVEGMQADLHDSLRAGRTTIEATERLLLRDDLRVELPRYITDIRDAVRSGSPTPELRDLARSHASAVERLTDNPAGIRQSSRAFMRRAETMTVESMERQLEVWVMDKARHMEQRVVRTESARALSGAFVQSTRESPWTKGYRWQLSAAHKREDVCDQYADQNLHSLGPGGYPEADLPMHPAHPHCLCVLVSIIDDQHFERELARERGEPEPSRPWEQGPPETAVDWMRRQPPERRREILGPGRAALFARTPGRVVLEDGSHQSLWRSRGDAAPPTRRSPELFRFRGSEAEERVRQNAEASPGPVVTRRR
jgi:hypothetical protein